MCFRLHKILSFYMGKMGKQDGRSGKFLGNPLNMLKNLRGGGGWGEGGGGAKIRHGRVA